MGEFLEDMDTVVMVTTLERDLPKLIAITEEFLEDTDMAVMVITLARDLPKLTAITVEFSEDMDMAAMVTTLERDLLIATMEEFLEDTDMVDMSTENRLTNCLFFLSSDFVQFYDFVI